MTLDEAIKRYTSNAFYEKSDGNLQGYLEFNQLAEWLKDYKRLLEQEPCEDVISRKQAIKTIEKFCSPQCVQVCVLTELPSVNPQEPFDIETYCKEHFMVMVDKDVWEKAEKALKRENVLDEMFENIKTEIDFIPTYGAKFADGSINVHVNKKDVLQIIDKYRSELDCRECKVEYECYYCKKYAESEEKHDTDK